jgi:hypothetical protein
VWNGFISLRIGKVAVSFVHGNELSKSIKGGKFLVKLSDY